ncbi:hypothetical protein [Nocardia ignorata]|uniref:Uncharacterized protein n=1 Tax=Nocardia ignorata TaxID=145285 RepID=A0A4R6P430_NOCIG|nr:hypothetical protein [Nocardia ignorata]TDP32337.1 hypothetical protein DFR75_106127 [Nocardia ignorata]
MTTRKPKAARPQPNPVLTKAAEEVAAAKKNTHQLELFALTDLHRKKSS